MTVDPVWKEEEALALKLARSACDIMRQTADGEMGRWSKRDAADWVTDADVAIEDLVRASLLTAFANHRVIGEERGESGMANAECVWYVDPVDGTCNYANGLPWNSFSLCLVHRGHPVVGVVADPWRDLIFHAKVGGGAWCSGKRLSVRTGQLAGQVALTELANHAYWDGLAPLMSFLSEELVTLRIMGSSALTLAHVAAGHAILGVLGGSNPVDTAAGTLLVREAGGVVADRAGSDVGLPAGGLVAGSAPIAAKAWDIALRGPGH